MRWGRWIFSAMFSVMLSTGLVLGHRHIQLHDHEFVNVLGPITSSSVDAVLYELNHPRTLESMNETQSITLFINSPGGSVHAGSHLLQYMRALQEQDITVRCIAENFMSMAFILFQACDERLVLPHSIGMQHQMSFALRGEIESMRTSFEMHDAVNNKLIDMEVERIGISREAYDQKIAHDWWIVGHDNVEENTADEVVVYTCSPELYDKVQLRMEKRGSFTFWVHFHKCPLYKNIEVTESQFSEWYDVQQYREKASVWDWESRD